MIYEALYELVFGSGDKTTRIESFIKADKSLECLSTINIKELDSFNKKIFNDVYRKVFSQDSILSRPFSQIFEEFDEDKKSLISDFMLSSFFIHINELQNSSEGISLDTAFYKFVRDTYHLTNRDLEVFKYSFYKKLFSEITLSNPVSYSIDELDLLKIDGGYLYYSLIDSSAASILSEKYFSHENCGYIFISVKSRLYQGFLNQSDLYEIVTHYGYKPKH